MSRRLGVSCALVDGVIVTGDVSISSDGAAEGGYGGGTRIEAVGLAPLTPEARGSGMAVPGFVDLQVNGFGGVDFRGCGPEGFFEATRVLASRGTTAVQPTFYSRSIDDYVDDLTASAEAMSIASRAGTPSGARLLPGHLEGPFLSAKWAGAHDPRYLIDPNRSVLERLLAAGPVGFVTLAPELPGALDLIRFLVDLGVTVSVGHSDATADQARAAFAEGVTHLTHCWNAHRRFGSRDPGPAGAALTDTRATVGLIADLVHVDAEVLSITFAAAPGRVAVTTDAVARAGSEPFDGQAATLPTGVIRGGLVGMDNCLRNVIDSGIAIEEAVDACGGVQRRLLGLEDVRIRPGDVADLTVLDDSLVPIRTLVGGIEVWSH
ncbi:MAG: amidohydrolase family protein [Microthrixaceae bacterium]